jgi:hypothetical protein
VTRPDPFAYGWWLASRASGLVALALLGASVGLGLAMAARALRRPGLPRILLVYALAVTHALGAGTDAVTPWLRTGLVALSAPLVYLFVLRVVPTQPRKPGPTSDGARAGVVLPGQPSP